MTPQGETLLVRGGTTSVGLAAAAIAKNFGASSVAATSRKTGKEELMKCSGVDKARLLLSHFSTVFPHAAPTVDLLHFPATVFDSNLFTTALCQTDLRPRCQHLRPD